MISDPGAAPYMLAVPLDAVCSPSRPGSERARRQPATTEPREEYSQSRIFFGMDGRSIWRHTEAMGQTERLTCSKCGAHLILALPARGKGSRTFQCFVCDGPDPMKTDKATGWLKGELHPPR